MVKERIGFGGIIKKAFGMAAGNFWLLFSITFVSIFVMQAQLIYSHFNNEIPLAVKLAVMLAGYLIDFTGEMVILLCAAQIMKGERPDVAGNLRAALPKLFRFFAAAAIYMALMNLGMILLALPALYFATVLYFTKTSAVFEDKTTGPLKNSVKLTEGYFWPISGLAFLFSFSLGVLGFVFAKSLAFVIVISALGLVLVPFTGCLDTLLFFRMKEIKKTVFEKETVKKELRAVPPLVGVLLAALILTATILVMRGAVNYLNTMMPQNEFLNKLRGKPVVFRDAGRKYEFAAPAKWQIAQSNIPEPVFQLYNPSGSVIYEAEIYKKSYNNGDFFKAKVSSDGKMMRMAALEMAGKLRNAFREIVDEKTRKTIYKEYHLNSYKITEFSARGSEGVLRLERKAEKDEGVGTFYITNYFKICADFVIFMSYENRVAFDRRLEDVKADYDREKAVLDKIWMEGIK